MDDIKKDKVYYGWSDVANLPEAIIFYAEMFSRGYNHHEICKMLDKYFPRIDTITLSKIRTKAYRWLRSLATNIETKMYLAKSIVRLERICANEGEKTKNVLQADKQLSDLLRLTEAPESDGPEELATFLREFNKQVREATDGTNYEKAQKTETVDNETENINQQPETETATETQPINEYELTDEDIKIDEALQKARNERLAKEAELLKKNINSLSKEIDIENEQRRKLQEQDEDDED